MDTNSISSNKVTLNISTPQGKEIALNKGEVLQAQVQETGEDGLVTIVVKGKSIEAFTEVAVKPGQQLLLIVDGVRNGKTYLKVVTPELMGQIENVNITANLKDMGIAAREENVVLSRKLLQHNLPVNQSNLNELNRNVSSLGGVNARNLEIAAFALTRGITGKNALESLAQFLSAPGDTAKLIPVLDRLLKTLAVTNPNNELPNNAVSLNKDGSALTSQNEPSKLNGNFNQLTQALNSLINAEKVNQMTSLKNSLTVPAASGTGATTMDEIQAPASQSTTEKETQLTSAKNSTSPPTASGDSANPISAKEAPSNSSKAPELLITGSKPNVVLGNDTDPTAQTGQAWLDGDDVSSKPKLIPAGVSADNSEASIRAQTTVSNGDKLTNATVKGEAATGQSNSSNEKVLMEKPTGSGNESPKISARVDDSITNKPEPNLQAKNNSSAPLTNEGDHTEPAKNINQAGNPANKEIPLQDAPPASIKKVNAPADIKVNPELVLTDPETTTGTKVEEQISGTRSAATAPVSEEASLATPTLMVSDDEIIETLMGREALSTKKVVSAEPSLSRDSLKLEVLKLLDTVRSLMEIDPEAAPDKIAGKLQGAANSEKDIVRALSLLVDMAKNKDMAELIPELKDFAVSLEKLEKEISGQQVFNVSSRNAADNMSSFYYFAFPVKIDQEYSLCQLKINKDRRKSLKDVDKISFVVSLNTSKLGTVLFHINWQKVGNLQLQGVAQSQASCNYLNQNIEGLISGLEALGYRVKNLGVKVSKDPEDFSIRPVLQEVNEKLRPLGIDVTV